MHHCLQMICCYNCKSKHYKYYKYYSSQIRNRKYFFCFILSKLKKIKIWDFFLKWERLFKKVLNNYCLIGLHSLAITDKVIDYVAIYTKIDESIFIVSKIFLLKEIDTNIYTLYLEMKKKIVRWFIVLMCIYQSHRGLTACKAPLFFFITLLRWSIKKLRHCYQ